MQSQAFSILAPAKRTSSVVFASPHSGRDYPAWFLERSLLDDQSIRSSEDAFVDRLFASAPDQGAPLLVARAPRALVDLNRAADELDPALVQGARRVGNNPRVASGLGVIPRVVANGRAIYDGKISAQEAQQRINTYWHPYHATLAELLAQSHSQFGQAILIDCHSMPREAVQGARRGAARRPEIVLGDRFGAAAHLDIVDQIEAAFVAAEFVVSRNAPFAGAYVTQHYGRPQSGQHVVQVEIDRSLYMDEALIQPHGEYDAFQARLSTVIRCIAEIGRATELPLAAE